MNKIKNNKAANRNLIKWSEVTTGINKYEHELEKVDSKAIPKVYRLTPRFRGKVVFVHGTNFQKVEIISTGEVVSTRELKKEL